MPPLPNTLYTRDTTCWIYGGVTLNPLYWPARHDETLLMKAIYEFHPDFVGSKVWWGDPELDWGLATLEGGDVLVRRQRCRADRDERTHAPARRSGRSPPSFSLQGAAEQVIVAGMPKLRAAMHLDTIFTFADRDRVTVYPDIVHGIHTFTLRPSDTAPGFEVTEETKPFLEVVRTRPRSERAASHRHRAATSTTPSANNGTAATTWSPSNPAL